MRQSNSSDDYMLEHVEDVLMRVAMGVQMGQSLPHDVHQEALDLWGNMKEWRLETLHALAMGAGSYHHEDYCVTLPMIIEKIRGLERQT